MFIGVLKSLFVIGYGLLVALAVVMAIAGIALAMSGKLNHRHKDRPWWG